MSFAKGPGAVAKARVIAVTSGKGGVGKTNISANLGIALAARGKRVCVFDADTGMANINVLLGRVPAYTLEHLISGERGIDEILLTGPHGLRIVPAASGIAACAELDAAARDRLVAALGELERRFDYLLIDTAAGASESVLRFLQSARTTVMVVTPEPTSLTNAFSLLKIMRNRQIDRPVYVLPNLVADHDHSVAIFRRFQAAAEKYLKTDTFYLGYVARDPAVTSAVRLQRPVTQLRHDAPASRCFYRLAEAVERHLAEDGPAVFGRFWAGLAGAGSSPAAPNALPAGRSARQASPEELSGKLRRHLEGAEISQADADALIAPLIECYAERFARLPVDARRALFLELEEGDYPRETLQALARTLGQLHERRYGEPLDEPEQQLAGLIAGLGGSEPARIRDLARRLERAYVRHFDGPLFDPEALLSAAILDGSLGKEAAAEAIARLGRAFERRFGVPPEQEPPGATVVSIDSRALGGSDSD